jgi:acid phosphatase
MLDRALRDRAWTAATEQVNQKFRNLPPAVIMDVDETVLDNSPMQARLVIDHKQDDNAMWDRWITDAVARPLPGALEFARYAERRGVTIFYVTNRSASAKAATRKNLQSAGFPLSDRIDTLYCRGEKPEWTGDKSTRRAAVAAHYRILLLFGDDLNDFIPVVGDSVGSRRSRAESYREYWGSKWIVLPNPMYGTWENALSASHPNADNREIERLKYEAARSAADSDPN